MLRGRGRSAYSDMIMELALEGLGFETRGSRLRALEAKVAALSGAERARAELAEVATAKINRGQPVTRKEAAAYLGISTKKLQRMEASGALVRCTGLGTAVRYAARDVLRLASAQRKER